MLIEKKSNHTKVKVPQSHFPRITTANNLYNSSHRMLHSVLQFACDLFGSVLIKIFRYF